MPFAAVAAGVALNCWALAEREYKVPAYLLYAMASVESSYNPGAIAHARNGTYSVGLMQVNSSWFPALSRVGISEQDLYQPCTNVQVGAWILSQGVEQFGYTWKAIGSYYAGPHGRLQDYRNYSNLVLQRWRLALAGQLQIDLPATKRIKRAQGREVQLIGAVGGVHLDAAGN